MSSDQLPTYAVVSPVCNEAEHFARTANSMVAQAHKPLQWVVVDDGSRDATRSIAESYAATHPWISVVDSGQSDVRARGGKIVRAFNTGLAQVRSRPDIVVKMDGDIMLPAHYFAWVCETFARMPQAGIVGGQTHSFNGERWMPDTVSRHNINGNAKAYRMDCFEDIGGLRPSMGWDGIDEYSARARGWQVCVLSELPILHYRLRGAGQRWQEARWEEGIGAHYMNYRIDFMLLRVAYRMLVDSPRVLAGLTFAAGFAYAHASRAPVVDDVAARAELRSEQRRRLRHLVGLRGRHLPVVALPDGGPAFWYSSAESAAEAEGARLSRDTGAGAVRSKSSSESTP